MSQMPAHLVRHLVEVGRLDADGINRRAHASQCQKCRAVVMVGLDDDKCAMTVRVDPVPLTPVGELEVLLAGRRTYDLGWSAERGYRVDPRSAAHIAAAPAGSSPAADVVGEHRCGHPAPPGGQSWLRKAHSGSQSLEECPF